MRRQTSVELTFSPLTDATVIDLALDASIGEGFALAYNSRGALTHGLLRQAARQRATGQALPPWIASLDSIGGVTDAAPVVGADL